MLAVLDVLAVMAHIQAYMWKELTTIELQPTGRVGHYVNIVEAWRVRQFIAYWPMRKGCIYCFDVSDI